MENNFVPCKESILLKDLGFDESCFGYYDRDDSTFTLLKYFNYNHLECISAPLYQQAFKWVSLKLNKEVFLTCNQEKDLIILKELINEIKT